ncbi:MAG: PD40 domain-containing protein [Dehalococcoidales bacterium]|nr:PD40 domain-containing protein [Dehalococcoidales bacterium]
MPKGIIETTQSEQKQPPEEIPKGIFQDQIPENADIIFTSIRYVLSDIACLDDNYDLKENFINDPECNKTIYSPEGRLASPRQLFTMDLETGEVVQITNNDWYFITAQVVDATTIMTLAACSDTDGNGLIDEQDELELYFLDLETQEMDCLTADLEFAAINNPDYSHVNEKILFSAQQSGVFHNYLFTINAEKELVQITNDNKYMDFDFAWSEDGSKIVFNRLPLPVFTKPSQVWLMDADGAGAEKITDGGDDADLEDKHRPYPIGTDADPDLSPDNSRIVFSRLVTGKRNEPIGVWELIVIDVLTKKETILDSEYANMIPEWKSGGILFIRQQSVDDYISNPMGVKQSLYRYQDGEFTELEPYPYNVFPIGANGASWITCISVD